MICNRCGKPINTAVHGRWSLPKGAGQETVCVSCATQPAPLRLEPQGKVVLIDKDGKEYPLDDEQKRP